MARTIGARPAKKAKPDPRLALAMEAAEEFDSEPTETTIALAEFRMVAEERAGVTFTCSDDELVGAYEKLLALGESEEFKALLTGV